jgi:catechol 2,3-dioxygenase-like lactoylglutathione lyase family enzyme
MLSRLAAGIGILLTATTLAPAAQFDHVGLNVPDAHAAGVWYVTHLGGKALRAGSTHGVAFGKVAILFHQVDRRAPDSAGSGIDHLGFGFANLDAAMQRFATSGVQIVSPIEEEGPIRFAFIKDPWGTLIEAVEDAQLTGLHHIHLATTNPKGTLNWYANAFGGKVSRFRGRIGGVRYGNLWLLVKGVDHTLAATRGRAIDHICWSVSDAEFPATVKRLAGDKTAIQTVESSGASGLRASILGPDGVRIELVDRAAATIVPAQGDSPRRRFLGPWIPVRAPSRGLRVETGFAGSE